MSQDSWDGGTHNCPPGPRSPSPVSITVGHRNPSIDVATANFSSPRESRSSRCRQGPPGRVSWVGRGGGLVSAPYDGRALDASIWDLFAGLVERNNGIYGGCWCIAFHSAYQRGVSEPRAPGGAGAHGTGARGPGRRSRRSSPGLVSVRKHERARAASSAGVSTGPAAASALAHRVRVRRPAPPR